MDVTIKNSISSCGRILCFHFFFFCLITITVIAAKNYYKNVDNEIITNNEVKLLSKFDLLLKKTTLLEAQVQRLYGLWQIKTRLI